MARRGLSKRTTGGQTDTQVFGPIAYLLGGVLCVLVFVAALPRQESAPPDGGAADRETLRRRLAEEAAFPAAWRATLEALCGDPVLQAEGIAADCATGTITFGDDLFEESGPVQLTEEGIRKLHQAIGAMLRTLRANETVWSHLDAIELRGHADPRARRDPYVTNMRVSQHRPMAIMFYLISDWALSERDRRDLESLLVLSAASHSRPPDVCPERTNECYPFWRRVEITPRLRGAELANEMARFTQQLDALLPDGS